MSWKTLGAVSPEDLLEARLEQHHAAQAVAIGVAKALLPHRKDDSHTALSWQDESQQWLCEELPGSGLRAGLRPADLTLTLGGRELSLLGQTRDEGLAWLRQILGKAGHDEDAVVFDFHYEMPDHPVADGARFEADFRPGFEELARYFGNAALLLAEVADSAPESPEILTWPHHFDMALLLELGKGKDGVSRSIGVGLSPGDRYHDQPYLSVTPYPAPGPGELPALPRGQWQREKFFGAVLTAEEWLRGDGGEQRWRADEFLSVAVTAGRRMLAGERDEP